MELEKLPGEFTVCKVLSAADLDLGGRFCFIGKTDEEISLVCPTREAPVGTAVREDGWRGFRIRGALDFSQIGILSRLTGILAENRVGIFAVSTYNTDYIFVKSENLERAMRALSEAGYDVIGQTPGNDRIGAERTPEKRASWENEHA